MTRRYRMAFKDWSEWTPARLWLVSVLEARAEAVRAREAVVVVDAFNLRRWRRGHFATAWQRQQAQKESP